MAQVTAQISFAAMFEQGIAPSADPALAGRAALPPGKGLPDSGNLAEAAANIFAGQPVALMAVIPVQSAGESGGEPAPTGEGMPAPTPAPARSKIALAGASVLPPPAPDPALKAELPALKMLPIPAAGAEERAVQVARFLPVREEQRLPAIEIGQRRGGQTGDANMLPAQQAAAISGAVTGAFLPAEGTAPAVQLSLVNSAQAAAANGLASDLPAQQPRDFNALIDRLAASRDAAAPAGGGTVRIALPHADFGAVAVRFERNGGNLSIDVSSADPAFAPAVRAALASDGASNEQAREQTREQAREQAREHVREQQNRASGQPGDGTAGNPSHGQPQSRSHFERRGMIHPAAPFAQDEQPRAETTPPNPRSARPGHGRGLYI